MTTTLKAGPIKRINVDRLAVAEHPAEPPLWRVRCEGDVLRVKGASIDGPSECVSDAASPLADGSTAWVQTTAAVTIEQ